jgi:hypothetical protein
MDLNARYGSTAGVSFNATPGQQYELAIAGEYWGSGSYEVMSNGVTFDRQLSPWDSAGSANTESAAPATGTSVAGQIFSQTPIFG